MADLHPPYACYGAITAVEDNKLAIRFEPAGDKKIMDAYVERA